MCINVNNYNHTNNMNAMEYAAGRCTCTTSCTTSCASVAEVNG